MSTIGEAIRKARKDAKLTQDELAKKTNLSRSHIGAIETNRYNPSLSTLNLIAKAVNVNTSELVSGLLGDPQKDGHFAHDAYMQQTASKVVWNPSPESFSNPETGRRVEAMNPQQQRIILASKDLSPEELDRIADLVETMAKAHRKD